MGDVLAMAGPARSPLGPGLSYVCPVRVRPGSVPGSRPSDRARRAVTCWPGGGGYGTLAGAATTT